MAKLNVLWLLMLLVFLLSGCSDDAYTRQEESSSLSIPALSKAVLERF